MKFRLTEEIWKEGNMYVAYCPELDVSSCGEDVQQAKKNLAEAILINIEETKKLGTFDLSLPWRNPPGDNPEIQRSSRIYHSKQHENRRNEPGNVF